MVPGDTNFIFMGHSLMKLNNVQNLTMGSLVIQNGSDARDILHTTLIVCYTIIHTIIRTYSYTNLLQMDFYN